MKLRLLILCGMCMKCIGAFGSEDVRAGLEQATRYLREYSVEIPNTKSPDGRYALFAYSIEGTTAGKTALATTDRKRCLAITDVLPYGLNMNDRRPQSYLTVLWSKDSSRVAIHDSAPKHSTLQVFHLEKDMAQSINISKQVEGVQNRQTFVSSGQQPLEWKGPDQLFLELRGTLSTREAWRKQIVIDLSKKNLPQQPMLPSPEKRATP